MTEQLVPTVRTTPSAPDFARALLLVEPEITKAGAGVLYAHFAGETGDGRYCWNWNLGNHKHVKGDGHDYVSLVGVWEGFKLGDEDGDGDIDASDRALFVARMVRSGMWREDSSADHARAVGPGKVSLIATRDNSATWFRAYDSLDHGMVRFVASKRSGRYASAWRFVEAGDHRGYAFELGRLGYYTASKESYAAALVARHKAWMRSTAYDDALRALASTPLGEESSHEAIVQTPSFEVVRATLNFDRTPPDFSPWDES